MVLGGSLCSEYLALQSSDEDECETVMEEKCFTQDTTHCVTQYVKVTREGSIIGERSSHCLNKKKLLLVPGNIYLQLFEILLRNILKDISSTFVLSEKLSDPKQESVP